MTMMKTMLAATLAVPLIAFAGDTSEKAEATARSAGQDMKEAASSAGQGIKEAGTDVKNAVTDAMDGDEERGARRTLP